MITFNPKGKKLATHGRHYMHQKIIESKRRRFRAFLLDDCLIGFLFSFLYALCPYLI